MPHANAKDRSRGISADMSPKGIARRLDILVELRELALLLSEARRQVANDVGRAGMVREDRAGYAGDSVAGE